MTSALIIALAVGVIFVASVVRGYSGFGFAMIGVAGISLTAPPDVAIPTVLILEVLVGLLLLPPVIRQIDGVTRELVWPSMQISHCRPPGSDRDIVLMHGVEPNMRWRSFCAELLAIADKLNVDTVVILGALLADTPHTRPVPVTGAAYSPESAKFFGLEESRYEGPTGIAGVFQDACVAAGIPAVTFWAAVPHYVSQPPNPKATVALLRRVEEALDIEVPLTDLPAQAEEWELAVTEMTADDEEIADYVAGLEARGDAEVDVNEAMSKVDGDTLAAEFERYLRRRGR